MKVGIRLTSRRVLPETRALRRMYLWAFAIRAIVGILAYVLTLYGEVPFLEDALFYEEKGFVVARGWLAGRSVDLEAEAQGVQTAWLFVVMIAVFYYLADGIRILPVMFIVYSAVTALVPLYAYRIAGELGGSEGVRRGAGWLVALSPAFVFWSGSLYKEGLSLLLLSLATYHMLRLQAQWQVRSALVVAASMLGLWGLRYYLALLLAVAVVAGVIWRRSDQSRPASVPVLLRQVAIVVAVLALVVGLGITERTERVLVESDQGLLVDLDTRRAWSAKAAGSGYLHEASIDTPDEAVRYFPMGLLYFLTVPFPWDAGSLRQNLIIPENIFWLMLYPLIGVGAVRAYRSNPSGTFFVLVLTAGMCAIYALVAANVGTAYRMRSQVWLLWTPFAAWGWEVWRARREKVQQTRREVLKARAAARRRRIMGAGVE